MAHVCNRKGEEIDAFVFSQSDKNVSDNSCDIGSDASDNDDKESDSDNDILIADHTDSSSDDESSTDSNDSDSHAEYTEKVPIIAQLPRQTRCGRNIVTSISHYRDYYFH